MSDILNVLAAEEALRADKLAERVKLGQAKEDAERAAIQAAYEARSPKQKHDDEIAGQNRWIANPKTASYYWMAIKDGAIVSREWTDECDCDDRASHDPDGHMKRYADLPAAPFTLVAHPMTMGQALPSAAELTAAGHFYDIAVGDTPIWEHRVFWVHFGDGRPAEEDDMLVFGVHKADGFECVSTVDHMGNMKLHDNHDAASTFVK